MTFSRAELIEFCRELGASYEEYRGLSRHDLKELAYSLAVKRVPKKYKTVHMSADNLSTPLKKFLVKECSFSVTNREGKKVEV